MRQQVVAALFMIAILPTAARAAEWVAISTDAGKRIEINPGSITKDDAGRQTVIGRVLFDKELTDPRSAGTYKSLETTSRYDCTQRTAATLKRTWRKADEELLREEEVRNPVDMPVRSGSIDDKLLREVCRPRTPASASAAAVQLADKANQAAEDLRRANDAMIQKETERATQKAMAKNGKPPAATPPAKPAAQPAAATATATTPAPAAPATKAPAPRPAVARKPAATDSTPKAPRAPVQWGYEGEGAPENWARLKPEFATCASGKRQSPIDLRDGIRVDQPVIDFAWRPSHFRIVDTGRTIEASLGGSSLNLLGKAYELRHVEFRRPAEERVNGKGFEMSAHFVHKAEDGQVAIVAVLIERGEENPFIQTLWNHLPLERNMAVAPPGVAVDPAKFLPADRAYFTYMGSLTTPPCTENVQWLILKQPVQASAEQIAIFSHLYRNNARPVQPAHGRLIKESR